jgi:hypothetical protein
MCSSSALLATIHQNGVEMFTLILYCLELRNKMTRPIQSFFLIEQHRLDKYHLFYISFVDNFDVSWTNTTNVNKYNTYNQ